MILLIDNYDSFAFNLARYFEELGEPVRVRRNDAVTLEDVRDLSPSHLVLSPGPCTPAKAGVSVALIQALEDTPILGVCLGHQCIAEAFGGTLRRARRPMHGIVSKISHDGDGIFAALPSPLPVTRYHSLVVEENAVGAGLAVTARSAAGEIMALAHRERPVWGVQFHPEAVLTFGGHRLLANFLAMGRGRPAEEVELPAAACVELPQPSLR